MTRKEQRNQLGQKASRIQNRIKEFERDLIEENRWWRQVMIVAALLSLRTQAQMVGQQIRRMA